MKKAAKATDAAKETASAAASKAKETASSAAASKARETASATASKAKEPAGAGEETAGDGEDTSAEEGRRLALPKSISPEDLKSACKPAGNATAKFQVFGSSALIQSNSVSSVVFGAFAATIALAVGCVVHSKLAARSHRVRLSETESDESIDGFVE
jgi:pyruvate/2-oxoglutarate dehydrogenase complex dihydrolipoamide acyltransferase (E2) component